MHFLFLSIGLNCLTVNGSQRVGQGLETSFRMVVGLLELSRFFSGSQSRGYCREAVFFQVSGHEIWEQLRPLRVSKASRNASKQSLMYPVTPRIPTEASIFFSPDRYNRTAASYEIKHL